MNTYFNCLFALLALINPLSKIFVVSTLSNEADDKELRKIFLKASLVATSILVLFALVGNSLLTVVFHVNLYAFQMVGGVVLFFKRASSLEQRSLF